MVSREQSFVDEDTITEPSIAGKSPEEKDFAQTLLSLSKKGVVGLDTFPTKGDISALINTLMVRYLMVKKFCHHSDHLVLGRSSFPGPGTITGN